MANHTPDASAPRIRNAPIDIADDPPVAVYGHLTLDLLKRQTSVPAVIVNPNAHPIDVIAWCHGELVNIMKTMDALMCLELDEGIEPEKLYDIIGHRMEPLPKVLKAAHNGLRRLDAHAQNCQV